jgi:hypothetical protein
MNGSHSAPLMTSVHRHRCGWGELDVAREDRAAEADDAGEIAQDLAHPFGFERRVIERLRARSTHPAIGLDDDR